MDTLQRKHSAIIGALVGDAAALGFHWLYDAARIQELAPEAPEFRAPTASDYEGGRGYYAHGKKVPGELTHYGEHLRVALGSLAECGGTWNAFHYQAAFCAAFERGGSYVGYIDSATAETLDNFKGSAEKLLDEAVASVGGLTEKQIGYTKNYTQKLAQEKSGQELEDAVATFLSTVFNDESVTQKMRQVVRYYNERRSAEQGADDNQLSAVAKLPAVVSAVAGSPDFTKKVEEAIRVTNDNEEAVAFGLYAAQVLEKVILGTPIGKALISTLEESEDRSKLHELIHKALDFDSQDPEKLGEAFGMACPLPSAIPLSVAILKNNLSYADAVRLNIRAGGDNAGRSIFIGAVLAAAEGIGGERGVPLPWLAKVKTFSDVAAKLGE